MIYLNNRRTLQYRTDFDHPICVIRPAPPSLSIPEIQPKFLSFARITCFSVSSTSTRGCTPHSATRPAPSERRNDRLRSFRGSLRICCPFNLHGAGKPSTFLIADRNLYSLPSPFVAALLCAWSRRGWPTEVRRPSSGAGRSAFLLG